MRCQIKQSKRQLKAVLMFLDPLVFFFSQKNPWMVKIIKNRKQRHGWYWYISYHNSKNGWYFEYRFHNVHWVLRKRLEQLTNHNSEEGGGAEGGLVGLWIPLRYTHFDWLIYVLSTFFWEDTTADEGDIKTRVCMFVCVGGGGRWPPPSIPNTQSGKLEIYICAMIFKN